MVWVITIATFLGTVAVLLMFFLFSQTQQTREAVREQRIERRIPARGDLKLFSLDEPPIYDKAVIGNASRYGARVVTKKPWRPNDHLLVKLPQCDSPHVRESLTAALCVEMRLPSGCSFPQRLMTR